MSTRTGLALVGFVLVLVAFQNRDLLSGRSVPFYRDLGTTQVPARALSAELGTARTNPHASFGQPYLGNPNFVLAYPFPRGVRRVGLHLLTHLALGLLGAFFLFRQQVRSTQAALFGALSYGLSGFVVSSAAFLNATTTIAWMPWVLGTVIWLRRAAGRERGVALMALTVTIALLVLGGEPALALLALLVAAGLALSGPRGTRLRTSIALAGSGIVSALLLSPWLREIYRASSFSSRTMRGFSFGEFAAAYLHPARFLETPFPLLFGDPSRLLAGGFWGFAVTQGNPPYHASLAFGILSSTLALVFVFSPRRGEGRFWIATGTIALVLSMFPALPQARLLYAVLTPVHLFRYPVKALLIFTLALGALASIGADRLLTREESSLPRFRLRASLVLLVPAGLLALAALIVRLRPDLLQRLLLAGWNPSWKTDPRLVLVPISSRLPQQALLAAALLLVASILLRRGARDPRGVLILLGAVSIEMLVATQTLLPRVPTAWYTEPSPLVKRIAALPGRVFERAAKDLDPIRRGLFGNPDTDDLTAIARVQTSQGWAATGSPFGLRYAYDQDPDGSYTILNRMATDVVNGRDWTRKLKWLRAGGVGSVLAWNVPPAIAGLELIEVDELRKGPTKLYRVTDPLPGIRRASRVTPTGSVSETVESFEKADFDPRTDVLTYGTLPPGFTAKTIDPGASARVITEQPDRLTIETNGSAPAVVRIDRSYTPRVRARVNGKETRAVVADLHLIGIPVGKGQSLVEVELGR
ncbi:MAG: hypothetical protein ABIT01_20315 [Thermoanaerobaculia bacterium]